MLTILGRSFGKRGSCDRIDRRGFLTIGGMAMGGITLADAFRAEAAGTAARSHKAIINIYLPGGPSHLDMWDLKPNAPKEVRGEFSPIATNVPGMEICELFPNLAKLGDKFNIIRSLSDSDGDHDGFQCMTGRKKRERAPAGGWPNAGSFVSYMQGPKNEAVPPNVALMYTTGHKPWGESYTGGFLGVGHQPFNLLGRKARGSNEGMVLQGITLERLQDRAALLRSFDGFRREADSKGVMESMDVYSKQALGILTTSKLAEALDLSQEDPRIVARYGKSGEEFQRDGAPQMIENFCVARRLVEAGARFVSLNYSRWDWHGGDGMNYPKSREEFPKLDQGLAALIQDLHERGLDKHVAVVLWGEFGRTPKINGNNSRDHWPQANACLLFGGGMRTGQVIGETNRNGEYPVKRPVRFGEVFSTLYQTLGIDTLKTRIFDNSGVPQYLVDQSCKPIEEVI